MMIPGLRLSGIEGSSKVTAWYYRIFAKEYKVYLLDRKDNLTEGCTVHDLARDTAQAMEKLGIKTR